MRLTVLALGAVLLLAALGAGAWAALYPGDFDAKNMRYVAWKHGLASIDLDRAVGTIEEDPEGKRNLILGQTKAQLRARFGLLLAPHEAGPVLERCVQESWAAGQDALYLRHS